MADPRLLARPPGQPPPLPPRPLTAEPFVDITLDPPPDTVRTRREEIWPPPQEPLLTEQTGRELRRELVLLREAWPRPALEVPLVLPATPATVPPDSLRTRTKRAIAAQVGKYSAWSVVSFLLTIVGAYVAKRWPDYADLASWVLGWLPIGGSP